MDERTQEKSQDTGRKQVPLKGGSSSFHTEGAGPHTSSRFRHEWGLPSGIRMIRSFRTQSRFLGSPLAAPPADTNCAPRLWIPHRVSHGCLRCSNCGVMRSVGSHFSSDDRQQPCAWGSTQEVIKTNPNSRGRKPQWLPA